MSFEQTHRVRIFHGRQLAIRVSAGICHRAASHIGQPDYHVTDGRSAGIYSRQKYLNYPQRVSLSAVVAAPLHTVHRRSASSPRVIHSIVVSDRSYSLHANVFAFLSAALVNCN